MTATAHLPRQVRLPAGQTGERDPRLRRRKGWIWVVIGLWVVVAAILVRLAYTDGQDGRRALERARRSLAAGRPDDENLAARFQQAAVSFDRARRISSSPLLLPLRPVPVLGRQLRSYSALTASGYRVAEIATLTMEGVQRVLARPTVTGEARVSLLRTLSELASRAEGELAAVPVQRDGGLIAPLAREWVELDQQLRAAGERVRAAGQMLDALASTLGGPRRYLLLVANNAEMRAGSGMFLSVGTIDAAVGALRLSPMRASGDLTLPGLGVEVQGDLADRWGWLQPGREWRNLATTPRFDVTAPLAAQMWERLTGERVDGVLAVDAEFLRAVLAATGPVVIGPDTFSEANVVQYILHDQYAGMTMEGTQAARRDRLGEIAAATLGTVESGSVSFTALARQMVRAGRGRHLLAWSARPAEQQAWNTAGISGSLGPTSLAVSVLNRGGNKLDDFLTVEAAIDLRPGGGTTDVTIDLTARNRTPAGEASYVAGPNPQSGVGAGDYLGIVAVNVPGEAIDLAFEGTGRLISGGRDGPTQVVAVPLLVGPGQDATLKVHFRLPGERGSLTVQPSGRLPPMSWRVGDKRWVDDSSRQVTW